MIADLARFFREARGLVGANGSGPSLGEFLDRGGYSRWFVERLLVPQVSAVWSRRPGRSSRTSRRRSSPSSSPTTARFSSSTGRGGARSAAARSTYVERLVAPFAERLRLRAPVGWCARDAAGRGDRDRDGLERFDEVVLAVPLRSGPGDCSPIPSRAEREVLGAIPYVRNDAVLHTDAACCRAAAAPGPRGTAICCREAVGRTTITYHMNRLQSLRADRELLVTLNLAERIDPATVIGEYRFDHPVYTRAGIARAGPLGGDQRRATAPTTAARTGAGAFTRTASGAPCGPAASWRPARRARCCGEPVLAVAA